MSEWLEIERKSRKMGGRRTISGDGGRTNSSSMNSTTIPFRSRTEYYLLSTTTKLLDKKRKETDQFETFLDRIFDHVTSRKKKI